MTQSPQLQERLNWLDVARASQECHDIEASILPLLIAGEMPCFGVSLNQRWVFGPEGALTVFDSPRAAQRFLKLLGINHVPSCDSADAPVISNDHSCRLYHLREQKLVAGDRQNQSSCTTVRRFDSRRGSAGQARGMR